MSKSSSGRTILLVEDEALIAMAQRKVLERHGYAVVTAYDGEKAIRAAGEHDIDLVLMDIDLGRGMDGTEAAREILKIREIPIVFLTIHSEEEYVDRVKEITRYGYVLKNSGEFVLIDAVGMAFELFEAHSALRRENGEWQETKERLRENEERYRSFIENFQGIAYRGNLDFIPEFMHGSLEDITGYPEEVFTGGELSWRDVIVPEDLPVIMETTPDLRTLPDFATEREYRIRRKDGTIRWVHEFIRNVCDDAGVPKWVQGVIYEITEQKEARLAVQAGERNLKTMLDSLGDGIAVIEREYSVVRVNRKLCEDIGVVDEGQVIGRKCHAAFYGSAFPCEWCPASEVFSTGEAQSTTVPFPAKDPQRWFHLEASPIFDEDGDVVQIIESARDISHRMRTEREREFLMQELNHRIKNNLLMVVSMINLKDDSLGDSVDLSDLARQVDAIRIIHQKLHQAEDIINVDIGGYIEDVVSSVFSLSPYPVGKIVEIEPVRMHSRMAVPLGLLVNEFATNAVKHGFPKNVRDTPPEFKVTMKKDDEQGVYKLMVSNNGLPVPADVTLDNPKTLGLRLITALVGQLGGTIELRRQPHPEFEIRFPIESD